MTKNGRIDRQRRNRVRNQFLFGRESKSGLARLYQIDRGTISRWSEEEGWEELRHMILGTQALAKIQFPCVEDSGPTFSSPSDPKELDGARTSAISWTF